MPTSKSSKSSSYTYVKVKRNKLKNKSRSKSVRVKVKPTMSFIERISIFFVFLVILLTLDFINLDVCNIYGWKWCHGAGSALILFIIFYTVYYAINKVIMAFTFQ